VIDEILNVGMSLRLSVCLSSCLPQLMLAPPKPKRGRPSNSDKAAAAAMAAAAAAAAEQQQQYLDGEDLQQQSYSEGVAAQPLHYAAAAAAWLPLEQQQQQQPDPEVLQALAVKEQQLADLQRVRFELETLRLLVDQIRKREKFKMLVSTLSQHQLTMTCYDAPSGVVLLLKSDAMCCWISASE
jgi:hypothetical protein